ncbi:hypothetical protein JCM16303_004204 [Sporobolomyces ruberrimus]
MAIFALPIEFTDTNVDNVALDVSGFSVTLEQAKEEMAAEKVAWEKNRRSLEPSDPSLKRYKAFCQLVAYYIAYQESCEDLRLPGTFQRKSESEALKAIKKLIYERAGRKLRFHSTMIRPDNYHNQNTPTYAGLNVRHETLRAELAVLERFEQKLKSHWFRNAPSERDIGWFTKKLEKQRDEMHAAVKDLFALLATLPPSNPFDDSYTTEKHVTPSKNPHGGPSQSLAKSRFRPISRRHDLL